MARKWRRDQIQETWTEAQWNEMNKKAETGEKTAEILDWNTLYDTKNHKDDPDVKEWNELNK